MQAPGVLIQRGWRCEWRTGALRRRRAIERTMYAMCVVIASEFSQLPGEVGDVREEHAIEKPRRIVPISLSMNGCETGVHGTDLISSISGTRRLASQRWKRNSGS